MVNMILSMYITILRNNVLFYHYRVSQEDGSMPCDKPVNVLLLLFYCAKLHLRYVIVHAIDTYSFFFFFFLYVHYIHIVLLVSYCWLLQCLVCLAHVEECYSTQITTAFSGTSKYHNVAYITRRCPS